MGVVIVVGVPCVFWFMMCVGMRNRKFIGQLHTTQFSRGPILVSSVDHIEV